MYADLFDGWDEFVPPGVQAPEQPPGSAKGDGREGGGEGGDERDGDGDELDGPKGWLKAQMREFLAALHRSDGGTIRKYSPKQLIPITRVYVAYIYVVIICAVAVYIFVSFYQS